MSTTWMITALPTSSAISSDVQGSLPARPQPAIDWSHLRPHSTAGWQRSIRESITPLNVSIASWCKFASSATPGNGRSPTETFEQAQGGLPFRHCLWWSLPSEIDAVLVRRLFSGKRYAISALNAVRSQHLLRHRPCPAVETTTRISNCIMERTDIIVSKFLWHQLRTPGLGRRLRNILPSLGPTKNGSPGLF